MFTAFTAGLLLITISELGDKTFFIAVILSMRHSRRLVFSAVLAALALMTVLSVLLGQVISLFPAIYVHYGTIILFIIFGLKLLYDASRMSATSNDEIVEEAIEVVDEQQPGKFGKFFARYPQIILWLQAFTLTFIAEWGDRTQISTITLAASNNPIGVTIGAILGHAICTAIAVIGGRLIAGIISERMITAIGGVLFLIFGVVAWVEGT